MHGHARHFRAMGTDCQVTVFAPAALTPRLLDLAVERVELLESCWSRFRPASELSRLNARAGTGPVPVSDDLLELVATMASAWAMTGGLCDPTVLASIRALGYDEDFATVLARAAVDAVDPDALRRAPGMGAVIVDEAAGTVSLPDGVGLDPGAIGKGLAGDIIVDEFMEAGATGVLVSLGGDIVLAGSPGADACWSISVADERRAGEELRTIEFEPGVDRAAIATSTTLKRRWGNGLHHLVDPRTGSVAAGGLVQATVVATFGWEAEAGATAALLLGREAAGSWLDQHALQGILLEDASMIGASRG